MYLSRSSQFAIKYSLALRFASRCGFTNAALPSATQVPQPRQKSTAKSQRCVPAYKVASQKDADRGSGPRGSPGVLATIIERLQDVQWVPTLSLLAVLGALLGPPMDGFHSNVRLLEYDYLPVTIGPWRTSLVDVPLLGLYYSVAGALALVLDTVWPRTSTASPPPPSTASVALQFGLLAAFLQLSAVMYDSGVSYAQIWTVLGPTAVIGWWLTDGTKQAAVLGALSFALCPVAEALLMHFGGVWHYPRADVFIGGEGVTSWTACCYAFYTVSLAPLARYIASKTSPKTPS